MGLTSLKLSAGVALLVGGFATQNALADSYVFVTNTTPQTVSIQVNQTGSQILQQGNQWAQEDLRIGSFHNNFAIATAGCSKRQELWVSLVLIEYRKLLNKV